MKKLILIDGNAILHRAYHALPPLTSSKGDIVNAVYGFFSMLISILSSQKPDYLIVCFDRAKPTFRQALFVGYQKNRPKMPDDLVPQIVTLHKALEKMNVRIFEIDGYEADDLIGTLAKQATEDTEILRDKDIKKKKKESSNISISQYPSIEVIIVSGDRDLLQLVNPRVKMLAPVVGIKNIILYDEKLVQEKFGVLPRQFVDYKALVGDPSDGYPGVSGIGPKTASDLVKKYNSFENIYKNLKEIPEKLSVKLATDAEQAALAKKLATIDTNAPITFDVRECACSSFDIKGAVKAFQELGFKSLVKRLTQNEKTANTEAQRSPQRAQKKDTSKQLDLL